MRATAFLSLLALAAGAPPAAAGPYGLVGNDTGGIIPWSPEIRVAYRDLAAAHCGGYNKQAKITSVHARYGDYVGFECRFPNGYDPVKGRVGVVRTLY